MKRERQSERHGACLLRIAGGVRLACGMQSVRKAKRDQFGQRAITYGPSAAVYDERPKERNPIGSDMTFVLFCRTLFCDAIKAILVARRAESNSKGALCVVALNVLN